ncbi:MAG TPA: sugar ABC transporter ATP-binding protein [Bradyrhizobium sp.]|uniref:sugar ABC transporter ATP-binding protein n=1 Tax=Bradyrhizobium sp. TaxID=376 RepID=UPI002C569BF4|nr:sugar ABC transporter ATP-binding protein [Bradyrhizobium sp.]HLZ03409.1 sugar ABC transporter ATP-binding protein [Bradyrhizobium sp.]
METRSLGEHERSTSQSPRVIALANRAGAPAGHVVLSAERISKSFAGVRALQSVDFDLRHGEVHALMGENGAGKSTLMKILAGVHASYEGTIEVDGTQAAFTGVRDAEEAGVAIIHQELNLVPELSVADNIFLGREPLIAGVLLDRRRMVRAAERLLERLGVAIDPESRVAGLRVGEQQLVEIAKALSLRARILIMDEPTSALSASECETLFKIVRQLAIDGVAIIYTSHRIEEVLDLADRVTVLRDGKRVVTAPIGELSHGAIISAMVGRELAASDRGAAVQDGAVVLSVRNLTLDTLGPHGWRRTLHGVSLELKRGEILGIGGLLGSGRTEILESIFGVQRGWRGGSIVVNGETADIRSPVDAYRLGLALVSEDRKERGLHLYESIGDNIALPSIGALSQFGLRAFARERALARGMVRQLAVRCTGIGQQAASLSGGNQQKVVIGKWLATEPRILLLDEPTRGIDVGAKQEIYKLIFDLAAQGLGIIVVTSEMPELLLLSDRILVMCEGRQTGLLRRENATEETVMRFAAPGMAAWPHGTAS